MKIHFLFVCFSICAVSNAQKWELLPNTAIQKISVKDYGYPITYFKKDSSVIAVPTKIQNDFSLLFLDNKGAFDSIYQKSMGYRPNMINMIGDTLRNYFKQSKVSYMTFFIKRLVKKESGKVVWAMTNLYGQGQPCESFIYVKRTRVNGIWKLLFLKINLGMCEI